MRVCADLQPGSEERQRQIGTAEITFFSQIFLDTFDFFTLLHVFAWMLSGYPSLEESTLSHYSQSITHLCLEYLRMVLDHARILQSRSLRWALFVVVQVEWRAGPCIGRRLLLTHAVENPTGDDYHWIHHPHSLRLSLSMCAGWWEDVDGVPGIANLVIFKGDDYQFITLSKNWQASYPNWLHHLTTTSFFDKLRTIQTENEKRYGSIYFWLIFVISAKWLMT